MSAGINYIALLILIAVVAVLLGTPTAFLFAGFRRFRKTRSLGSKIMIGIGAAICLVYVYAIVSYVAWVGPGRSGVVAHGKSPEGLEYCVVQTYKSLIGEPYQVSFFIRDTNGLWRGHYLAHQDVAWRSATVEFDGDYARVYRDGIHARDITMPTGSVNMDDVLPGYRDQYRPADFSVEDIVASHNRKFK